MIACNPLMANPKLAKEEEFRRNITLLNEIPLTPDLFYYAYKHFIPVFDKAISRIDKEHGLCSITTTIDFLLDGCQLILKERGCG